MKPSELMKKRGMKARYRQWIENPDTRLFIESALEEGEVELPFSLNEFTVTAQLALAVGRKNLARRLLALDETPQELVEELMATYGAEAIFKAAGYSSKDWKKIQEEENARSTE